MRKTLLLLIVIAWSPLVLGQPYDEDLPLKTFVRGQWFHYGNFFQAPDSSVQMDVNAFKVEGGLSRLIGRKGGPELYATASFTAYNEGLPDSSSITGGVRAEGKPHSYDFSIEFDKDRPSFDVGDTFDSTDHVVLSGDYSYRLTDNWQITGLADVNRQEFAITTEKDNTLSKIGAAARYRGFGSQFSPEVGFTVGERSADDPNEKHDQDDVWVKLRFVPSPQLYVSLRYRNRQRAYSVSDPSASNFGREDDRDQWTLGATYRVNKRFTLDLYYDRLDAESTKASRTFVTNLFMVGVTGHF